MWQVVDMVVFPAACRVGRGSARQVSSCSGEDSSAPLLLLSPPRPAFLPRAIFVGIVTRRLCRPTRFVQSWLGLGCFRLFRWLSSFIHLDLQWSMGGPCEIARPSPQHRLHIGESSIFFARPVGPDGLPRYDEDSNHSGAGNVTQETRIRPGRGRPH